MARYVFVRPVALKVIVEAADRNNAFHRAGEAVDDFMSDAMAMDLEKYHHTPPNDDSESTHYQLDYQGDAIWISSSYQDDEIYD